MTPITKNYAGMDEGKNRDCIGISLKVSEAKTVKYLADFVGGNASFVDGVTGRKSTYKITAQITKNAIELKAEGEDTFDLRIKNDAPVELAMGLNLTLAPASNPFDKKYLVINKLVI